ncbi:FAD-dependent monooxygenase [Bradyrhizobium elkanii]|uniref:FAD-dependent monooxygenase n=1 Tax=Bradyrhizobium elkanii TaxID=29448 RepID=UPI0006888641|nr:FAD-dependent monooxygenase [Bradyrhizobium elkanii]
MLDPGGKATANPVVIAGGGPVGLTLALALARYGVSCVVLEDDGTVSDGSRALGMSRRTQDIWSCLGLADMLNAKGLPWYGGWTYYRDKLVLKYSIPHEPALWHPPMLNIAQCDAERLMVSRIHQTPEVDLRWRSRVTAVENGADHVRVAVDSEGQVSELDCRYLIACDGARSIVRRALGLRMEGATGEAHYLIVDVQIDAPMQMGRRAWFDPPYKPGTTVLMHGQPDNIWRIDWQIAAGEDPETITTEASIAERVSAHLAMIGISAPWRVVWVSIYRAHARTLGNYRAGRILLAGDAAHQIPIFGIRGLNSGVEDAWNLAWKLARVLSGDSPDELLDSYSMERVPAAWENLRLANRALRFMTPPTRGWHLMRDAVLSLGISRPDVRGLINPQQATVVALADSPLSSVAEPAQSSGIGLAPGDVLPNLRVERRGPSGWAELSLYEALGTGFVLLIIGEAPVPAVLEGASVLNVITSEDGRGELLDRNGDLAARLCPGGHAIYLIRPDHHIAASWNVWCADAAQRALAICNGRGGSAHNRGSGKISKSDCAEAAFEALSTAMDRIPPERSELFLSKLALLLSLRIGDGDQVVDMINAAERDLE